MSQTSLQLSVRPECMSGDGNSVQSSPPHIPMWLPLPPSTQPWTNIPSAGGFRGAVVPSQERRLKMSHREISVGVDQLKAKPCGSFQHSSTPRRAGEPQSLRGKGAGAGGQGSSSVIVFLTRLSCVGGRILYGVGQRIFWEMNSLCLFKCFGLSVTDDTKEL